MTTTAVVTGANKGIGLETVRQLLDLGWTVWLGSRDPDRGHEAAQALSAEGHSGEVRALTIDVTDDDSVSAAAKTVRETGVDVLVNNAGIAGTQPPIADATADDVGSVLTVNTLGPVRVTHAFLLLLRRSSSPLVVNISSGLASFAFMTNPSQPGADYPDLAHPVSKAALNMLTVQYAKHVPEVRFIAVGPGYTATNLNGRSGHQTPEQAAANVVAAIVAQDLPSPSYVSAEGLPHW